jgi:hypothetical protein
VVEGCIAMALPPRFEHYPRLAALRGPDLEEKAPQLRFERLGDWYRNIVHFDLDPQNGMFISFSSLDSCPSSVFGT